MSEADNAHSAFKILEKQDIQVVVGDVKLPDAHGIELTQRLKTQFPLVEIILLTAYGTIADGVQAVKNGAFDYLTKGDDNDRIVPLVARATEKAELRQKVHRLEEKVSQKFGFGSIIGTSLPIRESIELAPKVALTDTTMLFLGETGTGKKVFAQAIHQQKPFVALHCSAFSRKILESELFGHRAPPQALPFEMQFGTTNFTQGIATLAEVEKQHIEWMVHHTQPNKTETARLLGIGLTTLYRKIEEYHL